MATITIYNYEAYLLDFSEGNLSVSLSEELKQFVSLHPELAIDLSDMCLPELAETTVNASFKDSLKRHHFVYSDEHLIDYVEGNLTNNQKLELETVIKTNSDLAKSFNLFQHTICQTESAVVFPQKSSLLKTEDQFILQNSVINYIEGQLSLEETLQFETQLETNPNLKLEWLSYHSTRLVADTEILYEDKEGLRKEPKIFILFQSRVISALIAAALLVVGSVYMFDQFYKVESTNSILGLNPIQKIVPEVNTPKENKKENTQNLASVKSFEKASSPSLKNKLNNAALNRSDELVSKQETKSESDIIQIAMNGESVMDPSAKVKVNAQIVTSEMNAFTKEEIAQSIQSELTHFSSLEELSEDVDENSEEVTSTKHPFWRRAVQLAKQVNNLGFKSINGSAKDKDQYLLSFNSFSIEKK